MMTLKEVKDLVFKDNNKIDYIYLIEYGKKITEEKISNIPPLNAN